MLCVPSACKLREAPQAHEDASPDAGILPTHFYGHVEGSTLGTAIVYLGPEGKELGSKLVDPDGRFEGEAPLEAIHWFARNRDGTQGAAVRLPPGTGISLRLYAHAPPALSVTTTDAKTGARIAARVIVRGQASTLDPSFGGHSAAPGAGPLWDVDGRADLPLAPGKYRITAIRGYEWDLTTADVEIGTQATAPVVLALRRAFETPGFVACDFHVHSARSFDSVVSAPARALSLAAAGIEFAVPSEHDTPGAYPARADLAWTPGMELTPDEPSFGHVGAFPWRNVSVPITKHTTPSAFHTETRALAPQALLVVHHPRFDRQLGYFNEVPGVLKDFPFDGVELINGYASPHIDGPLALLADLDTLSKQGHFPFVTASSDSHQILFRWAGYPRTYVQSASNQEPGVVAGLRAGHITLSSGAYITLTADGKPSGSTLKGNRMVGLRAEVRAAPWVRLTRAAFYVGGTEWRSYALNPDNRAELRATLTADISLPAAGFVTAVAAGDQSMEDAVPFLESVPLGIAGPIWIRK